MKRQKTPPPEERLSETAAIPLRRSVRIKAGTSGASPKAFAGPTLRAAGRATESNCGPKETFGVPEETTGFPGENEPDYHVPGAAQERLPLPAWVSDELFAETVEVWSEVYRRPISGEEAVEILVNVKRLGEALLNGKREVRE